MAQRAELQAEMCPPQHTHSYTEVLTPGAQECDHFRPCGTCRCHCDGSALLGSVTAATGSAGAKARGVHVGKASFVNPGI